MIEVRDLTKTFISGVQQIEILKGINLSVKEGEVLLG